MTKSAETQLPHMTGSLFMLQIKKHLQMIIFVSVAALGAHLNKFVENRRSQSCILWLETRARSLTVCSHNVTVKPGHI